MADTHQFCRGAPVPWSGFLRIIGDISPQFANIASLLYTLTQADVTFSWNDDCIDAFERLKQCLTNTPVLAYPSFGPEATEFILQADASAVGLGAVLEQDGHPLAYVSRSLTKSERNYSVIQ